MVSFNQFNQFSQAVASEFELNERRKKKYFINIVSHTDYAPNSVSESTKI